MELGAFSISLAVKDMAVSRDFYSTLGFEMIAGDGETWTINDTTGETPNGPASFTITDPDANAILFDQHV